MTTSPTSTGPFRLSAETLIAKPPFGNDMELGTIMFIISVCICVVGFTAGFLMYLKQSREQQNKDEDKIIRGRARRAASFDASMLDEGGGGGGGFSDYLLTHIDDEMNGGRKVEAERVVRATASTSTNAVGGGGGGILKNNNYGNSNSNAGHSGVNQSIQRYIDDAYSSSSHLHVGNGGSANPYSYGGNNGLPSNQPPLQVGGGGGVASNTYTAIGSSSSSMGGAFPLPDQPPPIPPSSTRRTMPPHADSDDLLMLSSTPSTPSRRGDGLAGSGLGGPNRAYSTVHSLNEERNGREESSTPTSLSSLPSPTRSSLNSPPQATNTVHNNNPSLRQGDDPML